MPFEVPIINHDDQPQIEEPNDPVADALFGSLDTDGHIGGYLLLEYTVVDDQVSWKVINQVLE